jgi:hypothetical protein
VNRYFRVQPKVMEVFPDSDLLLNKFVPMLHKLLIVFVMN